MFGVFFDVTHGCLFNHALADVRSTGAGIKCLCCMCLAGESGIRLLTYIHGTIGEHLPNMD